MKNVIRQFVIITILTISILIILFKPINISATSSTEAWSSTTLLPYLLASHTSFSYANKIFVVGGSAVTGQSKFSVISANIDSNGNLSSWENTTPLPSALIWHSLTMKNNYVYVLGGKEENAGSSLSTVDKVFLGVISSIGQITSWTPLTPLPKKLALGNAVVVGNRIYFAGGFTEEGGIRTINQNVYWTEINPDGTIGSWQIAGLLPEPNSGFGLVEYSNKLIVIGGQNQNNNFLTKSYVAGINNDATLTSWQETASLPEPVYRSGIIRVGSQIFSIGGHNGTTTLNKVYTAEINADGTLNAWLLNDNHLPQTMCCQGVASWKDYLYVTGGYNSVSNSYLNTVYVAHINNHSLPVPYFNQNALPWGPSEYDSTKSLGFSNWTMDRWGCAVTSAAMVLNYYGMTKFPDNTVLDPGSLNNWLKNNNGYLTGSGTDGTYSYISWPAIGKLSKDLYDAGKSNIKLMHKRAMPSTETEKLIQDDLLINSIPDILYVKNASTSGHFVVAKGIQNNSLLINDPEWNVPNLSYFNNTYYQVDRYIPSHTDLSYILLVANQDVDVAVTDPLGRMTGVYNLNGTPTSYDQIPNALYSLDGPISNYNELGTPESLGINMHVFLLPQPAYGDYTIKVTSNSSNNYTLNIAAYETDGDNTLDIATNSAEQNSENLYNLHYSQTRPSSVNRTATFQNTIDDINEELNLRLITNIHIAKRLIRMINQAQNDYQTGNIKNALQKLDQFEDLINKERKDTIAETAYQILLYDVTSLKNNLL